MANIEKLQNIITLENIPITITKFKILKYNDIETAIINIQCKNQKKKYKTFSKIIIQQLIKYNDYICTNGLFCKVNKKKSKQGNEYYVLR